MRNYSSVLYENLMSHNFRTGGCSAKIWIVNKTSLPRNLLKQIESVIWARRPSVEGGGGLYFLEPHNLLKWVARSRVLKPSSHSHLLYCLPCGLTVIHLRLCDRKKSLGARRFEPQWIRFTLAVNSCSGSGSAAVVSNCYHSLNFSRLPSRKLSLQLEKMAEIQARSQPPIFFH